MSKQAKLRRVLRCPVCGRSPLGEDWRCAGCGTGYGVHAGAPVLLRPGSPFHQYVGQSGGGEDGVDRVTRTLRRMKLIPAERVWSRQAKRTIERLVRETAPDDAGRVLVNVGAAIETIFQRVYEPYADVIRIGLPHEGVVDAIGDAMEYPLADDSVDLLVSSSVLEHIPDPERAIAEAFRVVKPGGRVYAEVPFMRAFHMAPVDYQRYTWSGIARVFERAGFETVERGVSSGPATAAALLIKDGLTALTPGRLPSRAMRLVSGWVTQPIKYLDVFLNTSKCAQFMACNYFYVGRKPA